MSIPPPSSIETDEVPAMHARGENPHFIHLDEAAFTTNDDSEAAAAANVPLDGSGNVTFNGTAWGQGTNLLTRDPKADQLYKAWQETCEINAAAGNEANQGWSAADHQIGIIESEFNELKKLGIEGRDIKELRDGIGDLLFTVIGLAHRVGVDSIADLAEVVRSNKSKFDYSQEDADKTAAKYAKMGVEVYQRTDPLMGGQTRWVTFSATTGTIGGKDYIKGKWLKSHNFKDVELELLGFDNRLVAELHAEPLSSNEGYQDAVETLTLAGPVDVLTNLFKTHEAFRKAFIYYIAVHAKGVLEHLTSKGVAVLREGGESTSEKRAEIAYKGAWQFLYNLLVGSDYELPPLDDADALTAKIGLEGYTALSKVDGLLHYSDFITSLDVPADRAVATRAINTLAMSLSTDPDYANGWHANLAVFMDVGASVMSSQLIAATVMQQLFNVDTIAYLLEHQDIPEETAAFLMENMHEIRTTLEKNQSKPTVEDVSLADTNEA